MKAPSTKSSTLCCPNAQSISSTTSSPALASGMLPMENLQNHDDLILFMNKTISNSMELPDDPLQRILIAIDQALDIICDEEDETLQAGQ